MRGHGRRWRQSLCRVAMFGGDAGVSRHRALYWRDRQVQRYQRGPEIPGQLHRGNGRGLVRLERGVQTSLKHVSFGVGASKVAVFFRPKSAIPALLTKFLRISPQRECMTGNDRDTKRGDRNNQLIIQGININSIPTQDARGNAQSLTGGPDVKGCLLYTSPSPRDRQKSR